jgi:hypothetical protein
MLLVVGSQRAFSIKYSVSHANLNHFAYRQVGVSQLLKETPDL